MSSAYITASKPCAEMISSRGAIYSENNSDPRPDPCGQDKYLGLERILLLQVIGFRNLQPAIIIAAGLIVNLLDD